MNLSLIPAYGKTYKNRSEVLNAFEQGKDFFCEGCPPLNIKPGYTSIRDFNPGDTIEFRYGKNNSKLFMHIIE